jgi:uncharacterized protein YegP (UPF0339 family)
MRKATLERYRSRDGFRWRLRAANGKIIADSAEAYSTLPNLRRATDSVIRAFQLGVVETEEKGID